MTTPPEQSPLLPDDPVDLLTAGDAPTPTRERRRWIHLVVQAAGFIIGIALLVYCAKLAFGGSNQDELAKLKGASPASIALLLALSLASTALNGLIFQQTLRPARRLSVLDLVAVNAVSSFLAYLPMKMSLLFRLGVHTRRDGVPILTIGAWFVAVAVVLVATVGVITAVALLRRDIDPAWIACVAVGLVGAAATVVALSRVFAGDAGLARLRALAAKLHLKPLDRLLTSDRFTHVHAGTDMLANPGAVASTMTLRVLDMLAQASRFPVAASIVGRDVSFRDAFLFAATGFLISILWPTGPTGAREYGIIQVCRRLNIPNPDAFAVVALLVAATEAIAYLLGAIAGVLWLGPTRLFKPRPTPASKA